MTDPRRKLPLTAERLRELLDYNPETGIFTWKKKNRKRDVGDIAGSRAGEDYYQISIDYGTYRRGRLAWFYVYGEWPPIEIDHINGIRDDDRIANLRLSSAMENKWNQGKHRNNTSGYKGVIFDPRMGMWRAQIRFNRKRYYLGWFDSPEKAYAAYCEAAIRLHGEFARFE